MKARRFSNHPVGEFLILKNWFRIFCHLAIAVVLCACDPQHSLPVESPSEDKDVSKPLDPEEITFTTIYQQLLVPQCLQCHGSEKPADGIDLSSMAGIENSFSWPPVLTPGEPEQSRLFLSIRDGEMPKRGPPVSPDLVELVETWIILGAKE